VAADSVAGVFAAGDAAGAVCVAAATTFTALASLLVAAGCESVLPARVSLVNALERLVVAAVL
jgi:hypothetical protein